jgi:hypothetical protein
MAFSLPKIAYLSQRRKSLSDDIRNPYFCLYCTQYVDESLFVELSLRQSVPQARNVETVIVESGRQRILGGISRG